MEENEFFCSRCRKWKKHIWVYDRIGKIKKLKCGKKSCGKVKETRPMTREDLLED